MKEITFLADESCDFLIVRKLRSAEYDVLSVAESFPSASDQQVLEHAIKEGRILLTEDKDFGEWVFAHGEKIEGVILIRFPGNGKDRRSYSNPFPGERANTTRRRNHSPCR